MMIMQSSTVKFHMKILHDYHLTCEISTVSTLALRAWFGYMAPNSEINVFHYFLKSLNDSFINILTKYTQMCKFHSHVSK